MAATLNPSSSRNSLKATKNKSHSVEKLLKHFPDTKAKQKELDSILEARNRGTKNDSSVGFFKALNRVNHDRDLSLNVKLEHKH